MFYTVYKITNLENNKIYVGAHKTSKLEDGYMGSGKVIINAINKHGVENFEKEILHIFDSEEEMYLKEKEIVNEEFLSRDDVYNLREGGEGGWSYINLNNIKNYQKVSSSLLSFYENNTHWKLGVTNSPEHRMKNSNALLLKYSIEDHHMKNKTYEEIYGTEKALYMKEIRSGDNNVSKREDVKQKISQALIGVPKSDKHKELMKQLVAINDGKINTRVNVNVVDDYLSNGWVKGIIRKPETMYECFVCGFITNKGNINRWHNDNCKNKKE